MDKKCIKCGEIICPAKARFYKNPLSKLCSNCRKRELIKPVVLENLKKMPDNLRLSIG